MTSAKRGQASGKRQGLGLKKGKGGHGHTSNKHAKAGNINANGGDQDAKVDAGATSKHVYVHVQAQAVVQENNNNSNDKRATCLDTSHRDLGQRTNLNAYEKSKYATLTTNTKLKGQKSMRSINTVEGTNSKKSLAMEEIEKPMERLAINLHPDHDHGPEDVTQPTQAQKGMYLCISPSPYTYCTTGMLTA